MKKIYAILGSAAVVASATAAAPDLKGRIDLKDVVKVKAQAEMKTDKKVEIQSVSDQKVIPLKAQAPQKSSMLKQTVVLEEDFNLVPDGETETIGKLGDRYTDYIASHYYEPGRYINNDYTPESGTWEGDFVMAGKGGTVVLQCYNPQMKAALNTPLGDYSGDITVTVRCRAITPFYGADNELGYVTSGGSSLECTIFIGGYDSYDMATTDIPYYSQISSGQIYQKEDWQEITYKFRNMSANADCYLSLNTSGAIEIDWVKVTDDNTYLACPVVHGASNFTEDGFTVTWDDVRRSYNYYIDLWKQVYTADSGVDESFDFETEVFPEWLSGPQVEFAEGEGFDGSNAVRIAADGEGNGLTMSDMGMNLSSFSTRVYFVMDDMETREDLLYLMYDGLTENGWEPIGYLACDGWMTPANNWYNVVVDGDYFEGLYKAVRVYAEGTTEDGYAFVDDMSVLAKRPFVLERVESDWGALYDPDDDDYAYNYYTYTGLDGTYGDPNDPGRDATYYTFKGLDPNTEYWYRIRSHNVSEHTTNAEKYHAFGVAAPELSAATNVAAGSYTANWTDASKAQKYYVRNYTAVKAEKDDPEYSIISEFFSKADGEPDVSLMEPVDTEGSEFLDKYTDVKGWTGQNVYYGFNMLGGLDYAGTQIDTPEIMVNPERGSLYIYIEAVGYYGDYFYIGLLKSGQSAIVEFDEEGIVSGWLEIPDPVEGEQLRFLSYNRLMFGITGFEAVQAVKAGDVIRQFDSMVEVPAGQQSYTFSNLEGDLYSCSVQSSFKLEDQTALSTRNAYVTVDMKTGNSDISTNVIDTIADEKEEVARYSIDGNRVGKDYKGVVLVKMNDGSVSKKIAK